MEEQVRRSNLNSTSTQRNKHVTLNNSHSNLFVYIQFFTN